MQISINRLNYTFNYRDIEEEEEGRRIRIPLDCARTWMALISLDRAIKVRGRMKEFAFI